MSQIEDVGYADGIDGSSIKMLLDGVPVLALQDFNWKINKDKKALFGAGFPQAHGVTRSAHKTYEIDFEIKEILENGAINVAQTVKNTAFNNIYQDFTDVRNAVVIIQYPGSSVVKSKTFTGVEISSAEGGFSDGEDADPVGIKCSGFATGASGLF